MRRAVSGDTDRQWIRLRFIRELCQALQVMIMQLRGVRRKIIYVGLYEAIGFLCSTVGFLHASDAGVGMAGALAVFVSTFAVAWNFAYNALFERWEASRAVRGRGLMRRLTHAIGFELGFLIVLLPVVAWWLEITYMRSFAVNLSLNLFFFFYTMGFTWAFDRLFGLPESAQSRV